jgi:hypothetical protein
MNFARRDGFGIARRIAAAWVALALVLLPVLPALAAALVSSGSDAACGHCKHGACCRRAHPPDSGPYASATPDCGAHCGQPWRSTTGTVHVFPAAKITLADLFSGEELPRPLSSAFAAYADYAYLYQRPPPFNFDRA